MNTWCGPFAIAFVLGISTDAAAQLIKNDRRNNGPVKGTTTGDLRRVFDRTCGIAATRSWENERARYGYKPLKAYSGREAIFGEVLRKDGRPTLAQWLRQRPDQSATYVVSHKTHWIVVRGNKVYDNQHPQGTLTSEWHKRRARVEFAWQIGRPAQSVKPVTHATEARA
jgi:hypothetical protein